jgi:hypothetical protein
LLFLFFLLVHGDTFLRRLVEVLPRFSEKRQAVDISEKIESDISAYLITVTIMNATVGIVTAIAMWFAGLADPILGLGCFPVELCPDPWSSHRHCNFSSRRLVDTRYALAIAATCGTVSGNSFGRGRNNNTNAFGEAVHS